VILKEGEDLVAVVREFEPTEFSRVWQHLVEVLIPADLWIFDRSLGVEDDELARTSVRLAPDDPAKPLHELALAPIRGENDPQLGLGYVHSFVEHAWRRENWERSAPELSHAQLSIRTSQLAEDSRRRDAATRQQIRRRSRAILREGEDQRTTGAHQ